MLHFSSMVPPTDTCWLFRQRYPLEIIILTASLPAVYEMAEYTKNCRFRLWRREKGGYLPLLSVHCSVKEIEEAEAAIHQARPVFLAGAKLLRPSARRFGPHFFAGRTG